MKKLLTGVFFLGFTLLLLIGGVRHQPWAFSRAAGFTARIGDTIRVQGYENESTFEVGALQNLTTEQQVQFRDKNGRALWAEQPQE